MKITLETLEECDALQKIIDKFDSDKFIKNNEHVKNILFSLKNSICLYHISNIDKIGKMVCKFCNNEWTAICSNKSDSLVCPSCKKRNKIIKKKGINNA